MREALTQPDMGQIEILNQTNQTSMVVNLLHRKVMHHQDKKESVFLESKITTRKTCVKANLLEEPHFRDKVKILAHQIILITQQMQRILAI